MLSALSTCVVMESMRICERPVNSGSGTLLRYSLRTFKPLARMCVTRTTHGRCIAGSYDRWEMKNAVVAVTDMLPLAKLSSSL